jgi:Uma2 family endonuclease
MTNVWPPVLEPNAAVAGRKLSSEDWFNLPEDDAGELVAGRLAEEEVPDAVHELAITWLTHLFRQWLAGKGFVFGSDLRIVTGPDSGRKPDVAVFLPGSGAPPRRGPIVKPPDILVEVVTPSPRDERRDRIDKMSEYATFGVRYYWMVDPAIGSLEIFELTTAGYYQKVVGATLGSVDSVPGCPALIVDVDALWAELARLANPDT